MRMLVFPDLKAKKGIKWTRMHVDRLEKSGAFPKRVRLSSNSVAWIESEVDEFLERRVAESRKAVPAKDGQKAA